MHDNFETALRAELAAAAATVVVPPALRASVEHRRSVLQRQVRIGWAAAAATMLAGAAGAALGLRPTATSITTVGTAGICEPSLPRLMDEPAEIGGDLAGHQWSVEVETAAQGPMVSVSVDGEAAGGGVADGEVAGRPVALLSLTAAADVVVVAARTPTSVKAIGVRGSSGETAIVCPFAEGPGRPHGERAEDFPAFWYATALDGVPTAATFFDQRGEVMATTPIASDLAGGTGAYNVDIPFSR